MRALRFQLAIVLACALGGCGRPAATNPDGTHGATGVFQSLRPAPQVTIPAGARLRVVLIDGVSTTKSSPGDPFEASLVDPVLVDGKTVLARGTRLSGKVADVEESGRVKGRASLRLVLNSVVLNGDEISIDTKPFVAVAEGTKGRDAAIIGGGTGVGAAIGAIAGGKKGAGVGALIGGGAGTGTVLATKGKDLHYPPETRLNFTLASAVQIPG